MKYVYICIGYAMLMGLVGCGLQRNLTLPKTQQQTNTTAQNATAATPATSNTTSGAVDPNEVPPSRSFMILPEVTQQLAPAMLSAPTR
jgi:hypothetical protein